MISYRVRWTASSGETHTSVATYDAPSAEHRKMALEATGNRDVEVFQVQPGK